MFFVHILSYLLYATRKAPLIAEVNALHSIQVESGNNVKHLKTKIKTLCPQSSQGSNDQI